MEHLSREDHGSTGLNDTQGLKVSDMQLECTYYILSVRSAWFSPSYSICLYINYLHMKCYKLQTLPMNIKKTHFIENYSSSDQANNVVSAVCTYMCL